jgi:hypothetical protein
MFFYIKNIPKKGVLILLIVSAIIAISFGIPAIVFYENRSPKKENAKIRTSDFGKEYVFEKELLSQFHWTYALKSNNDYKIEMICPTITRKDAKLVKNGNIISYSDGQIYAYDESIFNKISKMNIRNPHGKTIFIVRSGNLFETIINKNKIKVSLEVRDENNTVIGYSKETNWGVEQKIKIKNIYGDNVIKFSRNKLKLSEWKWKIEEIDESSNYKELKDPRMITMIIGRISFHDEDKTDGCNKLFEALWVISIIGLIATLFFFIGLIYKLYNQYYKSETNFNLKEPIDTNLNLRKPREIDTNFNLREPRKVNTNFNLRESSDTNYNKNSNNSVYIVSE